MNFQPVKKAFRYRFCSSLGAIGVFYLVIVALQLFFDVGFSIRNVRAVGTSSPAAFIESAALVFLFVVGLNSFKSEFGLFLQNGVSRRSQFFTQILSACALCGGMAVINSLYTHLMSILSDIGGTFVQPVQLIAQEYQLEWGAAALAQPFFLFGIYLAAMCAGYAITLLYYRMNTGLKIAVSVGVPVLLFILPQSLLPTLNEASGGRLLEFLTRAVTIYRDVLGYTDNNPWRGIVFWCGAAAVFSLFAWLLMRRAAFRK